MVELSEDPPPREDRSASSTIYDNPEAIELRPSEDTQPTSLLNHSKPCVSLFWQTFTVLGTTIGLIPPILHSLHPGQNDNYRTTTLIFSPLNFLFLVNAFMSNPYGIGRLGRYHVMEGITVILIMLQCLLLGVGDLIQHFKNKDSPTPEEENGDINVETDFALSASFYILLGLVLVPILALRMSKGNQNLGDETKISESVVRKTLYAHYPEAVAATALCISYLIAESTGCLFREGNHHVCSGMNVAWSEATSIND